MKYSKDNNEIIKTNVGMKQKNPKKLYIKMEERSKITIVEAKRENVSTTLNELYLELEEFNKKLVKSVLLIKKK